MTGTTRGSSGGVAQGRKPRLRRSLFLWGFADQTLSSATTFLLTLVAARSLGPAGLGTVTLGFAAYLVALGIDRSLLVDPLLTRTDAGPRSSREALRGAISMTVFGSAVLAGIGAIVGLTWSGAEARGLLIFAPWIVPALLQTLLKAWLYREGRGLIATASSAAWLLTLAAGFGVGLRSSEWNVVTAWGLGACAALAIAGVGTTGVGLAAPGPTLAWFRDEALDVGMWRTASNVFYSAATYVRVAGMSAILGPAAVGGYRAIETVFAPTSLIGPALTNAGIPIVRESAAERSPRTWGVAAKISMASAGLALAYVVPVTIARDFVFFVFGESFRDYQNLIAPIAIGAVAFSLATGFSVLLLAVRRMDLTALVVLTSAVLGLAITLPLAALFGLEAAAWGIMIAGIPPLVLVVVLARRVAVRLEVAQPKEAQPVEVRASA